MGIISMLLVPISLKEANAFVKQHQRQQEEEVKQIAQRKNQATGQLYGHTQRAAGKDMERQRTSVLLHRVVSGSTVPAGRGAVWKSNYEEVRPVGQVKSPAEQLQEFLNFVDSCSREYQAAYGTVNEEDKRLQDLIHEMEFAENKAERNKVATKLQRSRRNRRKNKDIVMRNELLIKFFEEQNHKNTLNKMRQLLGRQRKEEEFLQNKRTYKPRMKEGVTGG